MLVRRASFFSPFPTCACFCPPPPPHPFSNFSAAQKCGLACPKVKGHTPCPSVRPSVRPSPSRSPADGESTAAGPAAAAQYHFGDLVALDDTLALVMKHILLPLERHRELSAFGVQVCGRKGGRVWALLGTARALRVAPPARSDMAMVSAVVGRPPGWAPVSGLGVGGLSIEGGGGSIEPPGYTPPQMGLR